MSTLDITNGDNLDRKLEHAWDKSTIPDWTPFVKSLDRHIIDVRYSPSGTQVIFEKETHKTWFILKWS